MERWQVSFDRTKAGIPVVTEHFNSHNVGFMAVADTGSRDETEGQFGISHLLEHSVFRATKTRNSFQISKEIEGAGGELNAFTSKEMTAFWGVTLKETADTAKDLVADIFCNPILNESDVELEKKIVLQEIAMCEDDADSYIHDLFSETLWGDHPLAQNEAGTVEQVEKFTAEDLKKYYAEKYVRPNIVILACGDVDHSDVMNWAEENFDTMPGGLPNRRTAPKVTGGSYRFVGRKIDFCHVGMGFPGYPANDRRWAPLELLSSVLGSGASSRLFQQVREEKALVYSIYSTVEQNSDASSFGTFFSCVGDNVLETVETVGKVFREIRDEGITEEELVKAKNLAKGENARYIESTDRELERLANMMMLDGTPTSAEDFVTQLDSVTRDDIMAVADDIIKGNLLSVTMYGKKVRGMKKFSPSQIEL